MACTIYIDESGDTGFSKIRSETVSGSSPYFCMGAVVMRRASQIEARKLLDELQDSFRKPKRWKHATDLNHSQKVHFARRLADMRLRFYGLISSKHTLDEYAEEIDWEPDKFYNKCIKYLLEMIGRDLSNFPSDYHEPRIVVETRNHDYDALRRYLSKVKSNPIYSQSKQLVTINPFGLIAQSKEEEDLLRVADFVAHSVYSCVNKTPDNYWTPETRYWSELSGRFATDEKGQIVGAGLKCIHSLQQVDLDKEVRDIIASARGLPTAKKAS